MVFNTLGIRKGSSLINCQILLSRTWQGHFLGQCKSKNLDHYDNCYKNFADDSNCCLKNLCLFHFKSISFAFLVIYAAEFLIFYAPQLFIISNTGMAIISSHI